MKSLLTILLLLSCSTSFAGLFGPSNSDECIFDGLDEVSFSSDILALKRYCEKKYEYEKTDLFDTLLESCGFEPKVLGWWLPKKQRARVVINNLKSRIMKLPHRPGGVGWVTLYNSNDFGIKAIKVGILDSKNEYVAKYNFENVEGIGGDVNYKFGSFMPFSGDLSQYQWNIVNIELSMGDAALYLLGKEKGLCG